MLQRDAAPGIHRVEDNYTNFYLVEGEGRRLTIFDAGIPSSWGSLQSALRELGRSASDIDGVVLTHAHFDHIGIAERLRTELRVPIRVHRADVTLTKHPRAYERERTPLAYVLTQPRALPIVAGFIVRRALWPTPIEEVTEFTEGEDLPVAGSPRTIFTPGHTHGHVSFHFPDRDAVIAGDAVVTLNPYTGERSPQLVARAATADTRQALASLDALEATAAGTFLTGHGKPWSGGAEALVARARAKGVT